MMATVAMMASEVVHESDRVEQHADGDEEEHGESVAQRQALIRGLLAERAFAQDHAGEEGAKGEGDAEKLGGAEGDTERDGKDAEAEEFARAGVCDVVQDPRDEAAADEQHDGEESETLSSVMPRVRRISPLTGWPVVPSGTRSGARAGRSDQRQHHHEVFDDQPAYGDAALFG